MQIREETKHPAQGSATPNCSHISAAVVEGPSRGNEPKKSNKVTLVEPNTTHIWY